MKPYNDENCECHKLVNKINEKHPDADWNCDAACRMWGDENGTLKDNDIEFEDYADENYGCTCPTCGNMVCGWCV